MIANQDVISDHLKFDMNLSNFYKQYVQRLNNTINEQTNGTPISRLISKAIMQRLEGSTLPVVKPKMWIHYVDNTFVIIEANHL